MRRLALAWLNRGLRYVDLELVRRSDSWRPLTNLGRQPIREDAPPTTAAPVYRVFADDTLPDTPQGRPFSFSVIMPTVLRDTLPRALRSVFAQDLNAPVETLIGVDVPLGNAELVEEICRERPANHTVVLFYPGYSTSVRHGGLHPAWDGGAMRITLSYLARSRRLAYLDDDNWWATDHLSSLQAALVGHEWAWAQRWFVHPTRGEPVCIDEWESTGPGRRGVFADRGGWVDPNCLALDKLACEAVLRWWGIPLRNSKTGTDADRNVFDILSKNFRSGATGRASVYYTVNERDPEHDRRVALIGERRYHTGHDPVPERPRRAPEKREQLPDHDLTSWPAEGASG